MTGEQPLSTEDQNKADIDRDGWISAADLFLMLRMALDDFEAPDIRPQIEPFFPNYVRPGQNVVLTGYGLGTDLNITQVIIETNLGSYMLTPQLLEPTAVHFSIPSDALQSEISTSGKIQILVNGVLSNTISLVITSGPVLLEVDPIVAAPGESISLKGWEYGIDTGDVTVFFDDIEATPTSVEDSKVVVPVPSELSETVPLFVQVEDKKTNPMTFTIKTTLNGIINPPAGTSLQANELMIEILGYDSTVDSNWTFSVAAPEQYPVLLEVRDPDQEAVFGTVVIEPTDSVTVDAESTALWLLLMLSGVSVLSTETTIDLVGRIADSPELSALADLIAAQHPTQPSVYDIFSADGPAKEQLKQALEVVRETVISLTQGEA